MEKIGLILFTPGQIIIYKDGKMDTFNYEEVDVEQLGNTIERISNGIVATGHFLRMPLNGKQVLKNFLKSLEEFEPLKSEIHTDNIIDLQGLIGYMDGNKDPEVLVKEVLELISDNEHIIKKMMGRYGKPIKRKTDKTKVKGKGKMINVFKDF